jgi:hypothetical protein
MNTLFSRISAVMMTLALLADVSSQKDTVQHTLLALGHDASIKKMPEESRVRTISEIVTDFSRNHSRLQKRTRLRCPLRRCTTIFLIIASNIFPEEWETHGTENLLYFLLP